MEVLFSTPTCLSATTVVGVDKILLTAAFLSISMIALLLLRTNVSNRAKIALIYFHLTFLLFPAMMLTTNTACGLFCSQCHNNYPALLSYAVPATLAATAITGLVVIPAFYTMSSRKKVKHGFMLDIVRNYSRRMGIRAPSLYLVDKARPMAFSFRSLKSSVFLSVGMTEIMSKKEIEAVLLHELAHIKESSSMMKFSALIMKIFSPLSLVTGFHDTGREEERADSFAVAMQKTDRHIESAKRKIKAFDE